jgi:hypothetical protein
MKKILITLILIVFTINTYSQKNNYSKIEMEYNKVAIYIKNNYFKENIEKCLVTNPIIFIDRTMELEEWMLTPFTTDNDELLIEDWMIKPETW